MGKKGFTLIEVLIGASVFAIFSVPIFYIFSSSMQQIQVGESEFRAHNAAIEIVEQIISLPFKYIVSGKYDKEKTKDGDKLGNAEIIFKRTSSNDAEIEIEDIEKNGVVLFKKITVKVYYLSSSKNKQQKNVTIKTMVANEKI